MPATVALKCAGKCQAVFIVEDLDAAALGIGEPLRRVTCPRHRCNHAAELDAPAWSTLVREASAKEQADLPMGTMDLRAAPPRAGRP